MLGLLLSAVRVGREGCFPKIFLNRLTARRGFVLAWLESGVGKTTSSIVGVRVMRGEVGKMDDEQEGLQP